MTVSDTPSIGSDALLIALAAQLAGDPAAWTEAERTVAETAPPVQPRSDLVEGIGARIACGDDPLGEAYARLRPADQRRSIGATYTPSPLVSAMVGWLVAEAVRSGIEPTRIVDPGAGSGRFLSQVAPRFPDALLVGVETDPVAALLLRANAKTQGFGHRLSLQICDYRRVVLPPTARPTLFIGNPPYVRHHGITPAWKTWFAETAVRHGVKASRLAGLHLHFFLQTLELARSGDLGVFVTAAEWLDVNYGSCLKALLAGPLGGTLLQVLDPALAPFPDALTTAAITGFRVGRRPAAFQVGSLTAVEDLGCLQTGRKIAWTVVAKTSRWTSLLRSAATVTDDGIRLGDLFRVHRGQVTGANKVWIAGPHAGGLPSRFLIPTVTKARELLSAGEVLKQTDALRRVIDLPADLALLTSEERAAVDRFLAWAEAQGAATGYIARHRSAWWAVGLYPPAPIVCTYMARRPPAFVLNRSGARLLNIAHGLYPRQPLPDETLLQLVRWLRSHVCVSAGRIYAGGLVKFEPKEIERLPVPRPDQIAGPSEPN